MISTNKTTEKWDALKHTYEPNNTARWFIDRTNDLASQNKAQELEVNQANILATCEVLSQQYSYGLITAQKCETMLPLVRSLIDQLPPEFINLTWRDIRTGQVWTPRHVIIALEWLNL